MAKIQPHTIKWRKYKEEKPTRFMKGKNSVILKTGDVFELSWDDEFYYFTTMEFGDKARFAITEATGEKLWARSKAIKTPSPSTVKQLKKPTVKMKVADIKKKLVKPTSNSTSLPMNESTIDGYTLKYEGVQMRTLYKADYHVWTITGKNIGDRKLEIRQSINDSQYFIKTPNYDNFFQLLKLEEVSNSVGLAIKKYDEFVEPLRKAMSNIKPGNHYMVEKNFQTNNFVELDRGTVIAVVQPTMNGIRCVYAVDPGKVYQKIIYLFIPIENMVKYTKKLDINESNPKFIDVSKIKLPEVKPVNF